VVYSDGENGPYGDFAILRFPPLLTPEASSLSGNWQRQQEESKQGGIDGHMPDTEKLHKEPPQQNSQSKQLSQTRA
jgi:hypothetical protein